MEVCVGQRLDTIHSMCIDKEMRLKEELWGGNEPEVDAEETLSETV